MNPEGEADVGDDEDIRATIVHDAYLAGLRAGEAPDAERLLAENPTLAGRLRALIAADNLIACVAGEVVPELEDYRVVRTLGRGGMGIVYQAEQRSRGRQVALKVLTPAAAMDPQQLRRFLLVEVPAARLLRHPRIVPVIDAGCENGAYFYAMQLIEGRDLAHWIAAGPAPPSPDSAEALDPPRRAARWGLQVAEALEYAHEQGVLHRDIKPSNLMLDPRGDVWVTDFGLAHIQGEAHLTATGDLPGTPRYMSPEQILAGRVVIDHRTDIYSLGVTLYEILTRRPAFEGDSPRDVMRRVVEREPRAPRRIDPAIPVDLETIVLKAMAREREDRYGTAGELADDLRHFLAGEPIAARRPGPLELLSRSARKHRRAVATAAVLLLLAVLGLTASVILVSQERSRAIAAGALAEARARENRYESLLQRILRLRLTPHSSGWSTEAWDLVREAAGLRPEAAKSFQAEAAATLIGLDAHLIKQVGSPATSLAFDPDGKRLWMGGAGEPLRSWDGADGPIESRGPATEGPFAFRADGTLLQLGPVEDAKTGPRSLRLRDAAGRSAGTFAVPDDGATLKSPAISADGTRLGAVMMPAVGVASLVVWDVSTGQIRARIPFAANGMTFAPDASLLAAWDDSGEVRLWTLPDAAPLATLRSGDTPIRSVAFGRAPGRPDRAPAPERWQLATGDAGGTVTFWDLGRKSATNYGRGSQYDIHALAFSPDGTTLASAGRRYARLWDVATGRMLIDLKIRNSMTSVAFSPDGTRLAVGSETKFGWPGGVDVYRLQDGRGIRTLRGLRVHVVKTIFSPDDRLIAGLSQDWRVAIWDRSSGQVRKILEAPQGVIADNSGLAFSRDSRHFAFSAGRRAKLWDLATGEELGAWPLNPGLQDTLAFHESGRLMLLRTETEDSRATPNRSVDPRQHPRVMRLYELMQSRPARLVREIPDFPWGTHHTAATPDGKYYVAEGLGGAEGATRSVNAYDAATGTRLWTYPSRKRRDTGSGFLFDTTGKVLGLSYDESGHTVLLEMPTRAFLGSLAETPLSLGPRALHGLVITNSHTQPNTSLYTIYHKEISLPVIQISVNSSHASVQISFSSDGSLLAWGDSEGSVSVCNLVETQRRFAGVDQGHY